MAENKKLLMYKGKPLVRILVQLVSTDEDLRPRDRILKKAERRGLYSAIDIGSIWLERELQKRA